MPEAAAWNYERAAENPEALLNTENIARISEEMIADVVQNLDALETFKYLLRGRDIPIKESILLEATQNIHVNKFLTLCFAKAERPLYNYITERVLVAATHACGGGKALWFLLSVDNTLPITVVILAAVASNLIATELLQYIQEKRKTIESTESMLIKVVGNNRNRGIAEFLFGTSDVNIPITETVLIGATSNPYANTFWNP